MPAELCAALFGALKKGGSYQLIFRHLLSLKKDVHGYRLGERKKKNLFSENSNPSSLSAR